MVISAIVYSCILLHQYFDTFRDYPGDFRKKDPFIMPNLGDFTRVLRYILTKGQQESTLLIVIIYRRAVRPECFLLEKQKMYRRVRTSVYSTAREAKPRNIF